MFQHNHFNIEIGAVGFKMNASGHKYVLVYHVNSNVGLLKI